MPKINKRLIVVLGMHRSGTSTITRSLEVLGISLGNRLMPAIEGNNNKGFFEDIDINALNVEMLECIGSDWHCLSPLEFKDVNQLNENGYFIRAVDLLRLKTTNSAIFGFKDPRVAKLLPFWHPVFVHCGFDVAYILALRNPLSIAQSIAERDGFSHEKTYLLWLGHTLSSLLHTQQHKRVLVDYDRLLETPKQVIEVIASQLNLKVDAKALRTFQTEFIDPELRHTFYTVSDLNIDTACSPLAKDVYTELLKYAEENKKINLKDFYTQTANWANEFDRLKSNLRLADNLSAQINLLNQTIQNNDEKIIDFIKSLLKQNSNIFQKQFNAEWYIKKYPDINNPEINPYQHYILYGAFEGRKPADDLISFVRNAISNHVEEINIKINQAKQSNDSQQLDLVAREQAHTTLLQEVQLQHAAQIDTQKQEFASLEQAHIAQQQALKQEYDLLTQTLNQEHQIHEQAQAAQLAEIRQQIEAQVIDLAAREQAHTTLLQEVQLQHAAQIDTQKQEFASLEQAHIAQQQALKQEYDLLTQTLNQEHQIHEQVQAAQLAEIRRQIESQVIDLVAREQAHTALLQEVQLQHAVQIDFQKQELSSRELAHASQLAEIQLSYEQQLSAEKINLNQLHLSEISELGLQIKNYLIELSNFRSILELKQHALKSILISRSWRYTSWFRNFALLFDTKSINTNSQKISSFHYSSNRDSDMALGIMDKSAVTIEELFSYQDEDFICCSYNTLLGRSPDKEGLIHYLKKLRNGASKIEILNQLNSSKEGRARRISVLGLKELLSTHKLSKLPFVRFLINSSDDNLSKTDLTKNLRALENKLYLLECTNKHQVDAIYGNFSRIESAVQNQEKLFNELHTSNGKSIVLEESPYSLALEDNPIEKIEVHITNTQLLNNDENANQAQATEIPNPIKVTVVILTKNPGAIFKDVLKATLYQLAPWEYEVLVVDSGSSDGTVDFIKQFPQVTLFEISPAEFGHGKTRNFAVSKAKGTYVAMLTHDAKPFNQDWLFNLVKPLDEHPEAAGVFGRHEAYPDHNIYIQRDMKMHFNSFLQWPAVMGMEDPERYEREEGYRQVLHFFSDNNACLRKEVWKKIPYPDVNFAEDQLWAKAIIEAGYKRVYADDAVVYHSHDYSVKDTFRRSFDESRALKSLFDYDLCPSAKHGIKQIYACAKSDLNYLSLTTGFSKSPSLALRTPMLHAAKQSGWFIGRYQGQFKGLLFWLFSLDNAKKRKTNMKFTEKLKLLFKKKNRLSDNNIVIPYQSLQQLTQEPIVARVEHNKVDVIGFYNFVITEDAGTLPLTPNEDHYTINWLIPDFGIGSGGHLNIFRFINMLEQKGYKNTIGIIGNHQHSSPFQAREMIAKHFFKLKAEVVFGAESLPKANFSFATSWITAYALKGFAATNHKLYFVQDFEPAFYSNGSEYDFAEETYKFGFTGVCAGNWLSEKLHSDYGMHCHSVGFSYDRELYVQSPRREPNKLRVFCYCRPPTIRRGWESAMLALSLVGDVMPDVEFIFAGWDMSNYNFPYPHLNAGICSLKELPDLYSQCDAALVFSFTNLSLLPLELMACGCVVVSNKGANTEWLLNDENSVLPDSSSPRSIADAIIKILANAEYKSSIISKAKTFANATNWITEGNKLADILATYKQPLNVVSKPIEYEADNKLAEDIDIAKTENIKPSTIKRSIKANSKPRQSKFRANA